MPSQYAAIFSARSVWPMMSPMNRYAFMTLVNDPSTITTGMPVWSCRLLQVEMSEEEMATALTSNTSWMSSAMSISRSISPPPASEPMYLSLPMSSGRYASSSSVNWYAQPPCSSGARLNT